MQITHKIAHEILATERRFEMAYKSKTNLKQILLDKGLDEKELDEKLNQLQSGDITAMEFADYIETK